MRYGVFSGTICFPTVAEQVTSPDQAVDFEFAALSQAVNYRRALMREFGPHIRGRVLEVGAGVGHMTAELVRLPAVTELVLVEPETRFCSILSAGFPNLRLVHGTVVDLAPEERFDCIVSVNVLEHIADDEAELCRYHEHLEPGTGVLCLFVPARRELFSPIDADFGHWRRYHKPELLLKLENAGFQVRRIKYYNFVGYFAWLLACRVLGKRRFNVRAVRAFDRLIFPVCNRIESWVCAPPVGQSLLAIAKAK